MGFTLSTDQQEENIVLKLSHLKNKSIRYEPHQDFLNCCLIEKLVPKDLRLELGPTTENYDQGFVVTWYAKLKSFSLVLLEDIAQCDKTIAQTKQNIRETETNLNNVTAREKYIQIQGTTKTNEAKT